MRSIQRSGLREIPHKRAACLAVPFPPCTSCNFLDLPPGLASPFSLKTVHWTVFRALEPSKPAKFAGAPDGKFTRQPTTLIARYFLKEKGGETAKMLWRSSLSCKFYNNPKNNIKR
jgi:hypothetical protein